MNVKLKAVNSVLMIAVVGILVYAPLSSAVQTADGNGEDEDLQGLKLLWWILSRSEPMTVEGEAIAIHKGFLLVNTEAGQVRIALPEEWNVDTDVVMREMLFKSGYLSVGEEIAVKTLKISVIDKPSLRIYISVGYEIADSSGVQAYAILPINIEA